MVSNDVAALAPGSSCDALLLTPKARLIAPLRVLRRAHDDFLLLTEPELGDVVVRELLRARFAARCEIELEPHESVLVLGDEARPPNGALAVPSNDYGVPAYEVLDAPPPSAEALSDDELESLRIRAATPAWGRELDERVLPAEAGLEQTHISFTKGCYPGQEPIARLHYRGKANRSLRVLEVPGRPEPETEVVLGEKVVGRITSSVDGIALAYVRTEVPADAVLVVADAPARGRA